jgi:hypothetical protein
MLLKRVCWRAWDRASSSRSCRRGLGKFASGFGHFLLMAAPQPPVLAPEERGAGGQHQPGPDQSWVQKPVADAAHGVEEFGGLAQFVAQAAHVGVHGAGVNVSVVAPDILEKLLAGLDAALALGQDGDQFELGQGQVQRFVLIGDAVAGAVNDQAGEANLLGGFQRERPGV